jgi:hypothetical protein
MHFLMSLVILCGLLFVLCAGLVNVIWYLSAMSIHVSPHMPTTPHDQSGGGLVHANTTAEYVSNPVEMSEVMGSAPSEPPTGDRLLVMLPRVSATHQTDSGFLD